ncbi:MAG: DUF3029 family protein, partial [Clostridia bacterium]|nr:DUF3029 family protein [Clostridia bacterium]
MNALEIFYCHVPSITSFPVYLGDLDRLLEPFVVREDRAFAKKVALHGNLWDTDSFRLGYAEPPPSEREALARFAAKRLPLRGSWQPQAD